MTTTQFTPTADHMVLAEVEGVGCHYTVWMHVDTAPACTATVAGYGPVAIVAANGHRVVAADTTFAAAMVAIVNAIEADCESTTRLQIVEG